jgi:hypothetical protein
VKDCSDDAIAEKKNLGGVAEIVGGALEEQDGRVEVLQVGGCLHLECGLVLFLRVDLV